jgi:8-oxo-dGTP diphosphatase
MKLPWKEMDFSSVSALLVTSDGRYLAQLRDESPRIRFHRHWGLFGGGVKDGESPREALIRELAEELEFTPGELRWFTEVCFVIPQVGIGTRHKAYFEAPVEPDEVAAMVLHEGAEMRLFTPDELFAERRLVPWDAYAVMVHARTLREPSAWLPRR